MKITTLLLSTAALGGCTPAEVEPGDIYPPDTQGAQPPPPSDRGEDGEGDDGEARRVCSVFVGDDALVCGRTVRWHCSGTVRGNLKVTLPSLPGVDPAWLDHIAHHGFDQQDSFGPAFGASPEDPAVIACCEQSDQHPQPPGPADDDAEHGWACAVDCVDQLCRMIPGLLREPTYEHEAGLRIVPPLCGPATEPCYFHQLTDLANYIASHQQECVEAFDDLRPPPYQQQVIALGGTFDLDAWISTFEPGANAAWPAVHDVVITGVCGINGPSDDGWLLPPGPEQPCIDSNDNNREGSPFE